MRRNTLIVIGLASIATVGSALGQASSADKRLALTIYNSDLALVEHVRPLNVAAGRHRLEFQGVSAQIMAQTVSFASTGLTVIEQNFDYDLLTPEKLMEKAVGQRVRIVRTNPGTGEETEETAEVLSTVGGVVLTHRRPHRSLARRRYSGARDFRRGAAEPARESHAVDPRECRAAGERRRDARVSHARPLVERGLCRRVREAAGNVSLQGWITLTNNSGTTFANANAQLVAGDVNVAGSEAEWWQIYNVRRNNANVLRAGVEASGREQLADYYVYPLGRGDDDRQQPDEASELPVGRARAREPRLRANVLFVLLAGRARFGRGPRALLELASERPRRSAAERCRACLRARRARPAAVRRRGPHRPHERGLRPRAQDRRRVRRDDPADAAPDDARFAARRPTTTCRTSCATRARRRSP